MKKYLILLILFFRFHDVCSQELKSVNSDCFEIPKTYEIANLDNFMIRNENCSFTKFSIKLYNRWGQIVKESFQYSSPIIWNDPEIKSKVKQKNKKQLAIQTISQGQYVIVISYKTQDSQEEKTITGNITLL